jgi:type IV secretory pathway TraG/TraD family ATPase VirD4
VGVGKTEAVFNPLGDPSLSAAQIAQMLIQAASLPGQEAGQRARSDELFWTTARADVLTAIIELTQTTLRSTGTAMTLEHLQRARGLLSQPPHELTKLATVAANVLSEASANAIKEWVRLPGETTRSCVSSSVGSVLAPWSREPLSRFVNPDPARPLLNLHDVVHHGQVVVISVSQMEHAEELWPAALLLKQALFKLALTRARQPINQERMVAIVIDEATRLLSTHNHMSSEHIAMEMARSNKVAFILAAQNLSGLNAISGEVITDKLAALCGNQFFLANSCPATLRLAQRIFGIHLVSRRHKTFVPATPPPQLFPGDEPVERPTSHVTLVPVEVPVVSAATLSRLPTGWGRAKLVDGSVHRFRCSFE